MLMTSLVVILASFAKQNPENITAWNFDTASKLIKSHYVIFCLLSLFQTNNSNQMDLKNG